MSNRLGSHAVVIGGSIAGMATARVLADHFDQVTVCERDRVEDRPVPHKSVPQGNHVHVLLQGGQDVMASLYPGIIAELERRGSIRWRIGADLAFYLPEGKAYNLTGSVKEPRDLGMVGHGQSRGLLEYVIRRMTLKLPNVKFTGGVTVEELLNGGARVRGVRFDQRSGGGTLDADLVVDAGGRGSRAPRWLTAMGFQPPAETTIGVDFAYASAYYRKPAGYAEESGVLVGGRPPLQPSGGLIFEIENGLWHVSLAGRFGDYPPTDEAGFLEFAKRLPSPRIYELIKDAERAGDLTQHRFPTSIQRHYEQMPSFPEGFLVIGDAVGSFNPVYGQGMSSAALQVAALRRVLDAVVEQGRGLGGLASEFFPQAANVISAPWILAANFDFAFPQTVGQRPPAMEQGARYFVVLDSLQNDDIEVQRLLTEVFQLMRPLSALWDEPIRSRVMARLQRLTV